MKDEDFQKQRDEIHARQARLDEMKAEQASQPEPTPQKPSIPKDSKPPAQKIKPIHLVIPGIAINFVILGIAMFILGWVVCSETSTPDRPKLSKSENLQPIDSPRKSNIPAWPSREEVMEGSQMGEPVLNKNGLVIYNKSRLYVVFYKEKSILIYCYLHDADWGKNRDFREAEKTRIIQKIIPTWNNAYKEGIQGLWHQMSAVKGGILNCKGMRYNGVKISNFDRVRRGHAISEMVMFSEVDNQSIGPADAKDIYIDFRLAEDKRAPTWIESENRWSNQSKDGSMTFKDW